MYEGIQVSACVHMLVSVWRGSNDAVSRHIRPPNKKTARVQSANQNNKIYRHAHWKRDVASRDDNLPITTQIV